MVPPSLPVTRTALNSCCDQLGKWVLVLRGRQSTASGDFLCHLELLKLIFAFCMVLNDPRGMIFMFQSCLSSLLELLY